MGPMNPSGSRPSTYNATWVWHLKALGLKPSSPETQMNDSPHEAHTTGIKSNDMIVCGSPVRRRYREGIDEVFEHSWFPPAKVVPPTTVKPPAKELLSAVEHASSNRYSNLEKGCMVSSLGEPTTDLSSSPCHGSSSSPTLFDGRGFETLACSPSVLSHLKASGA